MASITVPTIDTSVSFTEYDQTSRKLKPRVLRTKQIKAVYDTLPPDLLRQDNFFREFVNSRIIYEENDKLHIIFLSETIEQIQVTFDTLSNL